MHSIDIDFDVFKAITALRESESVTENDVLRNLLGLNDKREDITDPKSLNLNTQGQPWASKGVVFPHGTKFRATYKGQQYTAIIDDGALVLDRKRYGSPSAAAVSITNNPVNGWRFWECLLPGTSRWKTIAKFRK